MPHAALLVVQQKEEFKMAKRRIKFQCRTRLCGWCSNVSRVAEMARGGFNAARGYSLSPPPPLRGPPPPLAQGRLGYAPFSRRITQYQLPPPMRGSGQRLPITLRFTRVLGTFSHTTCFPFSCALWACFSDRSVSGERSEPIGALMPHAALWVVQQGGSCDGPHLSNVSMPHAA